MPTLVKLYEQTKQTEKAITTYERTIEISDKPKLGMKDDFQNEIERLKKI